MNERARPRGLTCAARGSTHTLLLLGLIIFGGPAMAHAGLPDIDSLWDYHDPVGTESRFRELVSRAEASGDTGYRVELQTQIARTLGLQRQFDAAHKTLDDIEPLLEAAGDRARVRYLLERGRVFNSSGRADYADPLFQEAWEHARAHGFEALAVDAAHMVAIVRSGDESLEWNRRAMAAAESSDDPRARRWLGSLYNNIGWAHFGSGEYDTALAMFTRALAFRVDQGLTREVLIARWCVAKCLRHMDRIDAALEQQLELERDWDDFGEQDGYVYEEIAECLQALDRPADAAPYFRKAYDLLSADAWLLAEEPARLERLNALGGPR